MIESFAPVVNKNSRILILGTMPGEESLRQQQYYAHPRNLFWPLIYKIFDKTPDSDYDKRVQFLLDQGLALWDVFKSCERIGSLDSNIQKEKINDISGLLEEFPAIKYVFCNSEKAAKHFRKRVLPLVNRPVFHMRLPSTSPANASIRYEDKLSQWLQIRYALENRVVHESILKTDLGEFTILSNEEEVIRIFPPGSNKAERKQYAVFPENEQGRNAAEQIKKYLSEKGKDSRHNA